VQATVAQFRAGESVGGEERTELHFQALKRLLDRSEADYASLKSPRTASEPTAGTRWWIVGLLAAALFINYVDRGAVPTAAHLIQDELGFSGANWGCCSRRSSGPIPCCRSRSVGGRALWRTAGPGRGARGVGVRHHAWSASRSPSPALLALRLLLGIGESAGFPAVSKIARNGGTVKSLGTANGIVAFAYLLGPAVGAYCGGLIMVEFGWRAASGYSVGSPAVAVALVAGRAAATGRCRRSTDDGPALHTLLRQSSSGARVSAVFEQLPPSTSC